MYSRSGSWHLPPKTTYTDWARLCISRFKQTTCQCFQPNPSTAHTPPARLERAFSELLHSVTHMMGK